MVQIVSKKRLYKSESLDIARFLDSKAHIGKAQIWDSAKEDLITLLSSDTPYNRAIFIEPPGAGKCVVGETRVHSSKGYLKISDFCEDPFLYQDKFVPLTVGVWEGQITSAFYYGGLQDTKKIFATNFELEGTLSHRVKCLTDEGIVWKDLKSINKGDYVCLCASQSLLFENVLPDFSEVFRGDDFRKGWLVGFLLGDGNVSKYGISYGGTKSICEKISAWVVPSAKMYRKAGTDSYNLFVGGVKTASVLMDVGLGGTPYTKRLPDWVYASNREFIVGLLSGMVDSDGHIGRSGLEITLASYQLCVGLRDLFNLMGVFPSLKEKKRKHSGVPRTYYRLMIPRSRLSKCQFLLLEVPDKEAALREALQRECRGRIVPKKQVFVEEILKLYFEYVVPFSSKDRKQNRSQMAFIDHLRDPRRKYILEGTWDKFKVLLPEKVWKESVTQKILDKYDFSEVEAVSEGREYVYDLTVPEGHRFMANGLENHNSTKGALFLFYCLYKLGNLVDPHLYFGLDPHSLLGVINMSISSRTATGTIWETLRNLLIESPWFNKYCPVNSKVQSEIRLPKPLFALAGNSSEAFPAGWNAYGAVVDEITMFLQKSHKGAYSDQAKNIFEVLEERTESRFMDDGYVLAMGASSYLNDFVEEMIKRAESEGGENILLVRRPLWFSKPRNCFSKEGRYFLFDTDTMKIVPDSEGVGLFTEENKREILEQISKGLKSKEVSANLDPVPDVAKGVSNRPRLLKNKVIRMSAV